MRYFSTFSGVGGFELGIKLAYEQISGIENISKKTKRQEANKKIRGKKRQFKQLPEYAPARLSCIGYSEIDKYATKVYQKHFPKHKNWGDITKINPEELPDFDLLVGGFPCQSFSIAGKRRGFEDTRGTLFFEIARIVREKKPRLLLLENVKGLLSHGNGSTFYTIITTLDELGYDCQWQVLNSKNHGVPQNRERVFIIGSRRGTKRPNVFPLNCENDLTTVESGGQVQQQDSQNDNRQAGLKETLRALESSPLLFAVQPYKGGLFYSIGDGKDWVNIYKTKVEKICQQQISLRSILEEHPDQKYFLAGQANGTYIAESKFNEQKIRRLTPTECERLQGFPDGWTDGASDSQRYKMLGNAVTVNVVQAIMEKMIDTINK